MSELSLTERDIEDFKQNPVWVEMLTTWTIRRAGYLEELSKAADMEEVKKIQGCITEIDYCIQQPDFILMEVQDEEEEEKTEPDED